jgi:O-antigen/teichoic acid export membrane protein
MSTSDDLDSAAPATSDGMGRRAVRNSAIVMAARVASRVIALVTVIAMAQHLGDLGFGEMQTVITYAALVNVALDLGYGTLFVREGARHPDQISSYLATLLSLKAATAVLSLIGLAALLAIPGFEPLLLPGFCLMVSSAYSNLLRSSLYALQRLTYEAIAIVAESALQMGLTFWGVAHHAGVAYYIWTYVISYVATTIYFIVALSAHRMVKVRFGWDFALLRRWFMTSVAVGFTAVVTIIYFKIDVPLLQQICPHAAGQSCDREVGWYTLAYKPFEALLFLPFTLRSIVFPVLSIYYKDRADRLGIATEKFYRGLLLLAWPTAIGLFILTGPINGLLRLYPQSEASLHILAVGIVFVFLDNTFISALLAMNRQRLFFYVALAGLVFNLALNGILIPTNGYLGASWATVITEAFLCCAGWWCLRREGMTLNVVRLSWRIVLSGLIMGVALLPFTHTRGAGLIATIIGGAVVYGVAVLLLRTADEDEWMLVRRAVGMGRRDR